MSEEKNPFEETAPSYDERVKELGEMDIPSMIANDPVLRYVDAAKGRSRAKREKSSLDEALEIVKAHLDSGKSFTNAQLDICTEVVATQLPQSDREILHEIAQSNTYPLWIALLAQWRRCVEYGENFALLVDPDWIEKAEGV